jgi:hypothetical protein
MDILGNNELSIQISEMLLEVGATELLDAPWRLATRDDSSMGNRSMWGS